MRRKILPLIAMTIGLACPVLAQDDVGAKLAAAERYVRAVEMQTLVENMLTVMAHKLPPEKRDTFLKRFKQEVSRSRMEAIMVNAMVQVYEADELNAAADFYSSPQGQAILQKSSRFMAAAMPAMEAEMDKILQAMGVPKK